MKSNRTVLAVLATVAALAGPALSEEPANAVPVAGPGGASNGAGVSVTFDGRGFGHGKGLSQYGALGRARAGQSYRQIVQHYYPGTEWGSSGGPVRVLISRDTTSDVVVEARSGLTARSLASGKSWTLPTKRGGTSVDKWRITPASGHRSTISYRTGGWHAWRTVSGDAQVAAGGQPVALHTPDGVVRYRGTLRSSSASASGMDRDTVNILPLESYLRGVVPREVPALWPSAAVRAQAVAARTYAAYERAHPEGTYFQICDTAACQVYGGASAEHPSSDAAVRATAGRVVTFDGAPAFAQFSASNGGYSAPGDFSYLTAAQDDFDTYPGWTATFTGDEVTRHWTGLGALQSVAVDEVDQSGRATWVIVTGDDSSVRVRGSDLARYLGLKSTLFSIDDVQSADPPGAATARRPQ